jgi:hypothetical protein
VKPYCTPSTTPAWRVGSQLTCENATFACQNATWRLSTLEAIEEELPVLVIVGDRLPVVPSTHHVINPSGMLNSVLPSRFQAGTAPSLRQRQRLS